jgi:hypothetical protein
MKSRPRTSVDAVQPAGRYTARFDVGDLPSGLYIARLLGGSFERSRKMMLLR